MYILGIHSGHDAAACLLKDQDLVAFCKEERLTRVKCDGRRFDLEAVNEVLEIGGISREDLDVVALSRLQVPLSCFKKTSHKFRDQFRKIRGARRDRNLFKEMTALGEPNENFIIDKNRLRKSLGVRDDTEICFCNHHLSHVLGSFKYTDWKNDALFVSCDGGGDGAQYSACFYNGNNLELIWGGDETIMNPQNAGASVGLAYAFVTKMCGFRPMRHEGKITGLAAFGEPVAGDRIRQQFKVTPDGRIETDLQGYRGLSSFLKTTLEGCSKEDMAASVQYATEEVVLEWIQNLLNRTGAKFVGMSGGVFSNVRLNQKVAKLKEVAEVFIFPAMGDEGLPVGQCIDVLIGKYGCNGLKRERLGHVFFGRKFAARDLVAEAYKLGFRVELKASVADECAAELAIGKIGGIFHGAMEMGPRALGARSIIASPANNELNHSLNNRLDRTEFMPFAPYVLEEDVSTVFTVDDCMIEACLFMTITADVNPRYQSLIPAVVHVDGTARPQIVKRSLHPLYYDILKSFKKKTGMPCLVNTSFNVHEEPIINTPQQALDALRDKRIDFLVCDEGLIYVQ